MPNILRPVSKVMYFLEINPSEVKPNITAPKNLIIKGSPDKNPL